MPVGTPMSMPGWQASQARRSQNGEVIGPLTGQMSVPAAALDRAARAAAAAALGAARVIFACCAWRSTFSVALELVALGADRASSALLLVGARVVVADARVDQVLLDARDLAAALTRICAVSRCWRCSSVRRAPRGRDRVGVGRVAHARDDRAVLLGDALEEVRALEQVGEAVGAQHDADEVGLVGLVDLDEPRGEQRRGRRRAARAAGPGGRAGRGGSSWTRQLGALGVEVGLDPLLAGPQRA